MRSGCSAVILWTGMRWRGFGRWGSTRALAPLAGTQHWLVPARLRVVGGFSCGCGWKYGGVVCAVRVAGFASGLGGPAGPVWWVCASQGPGLSSLWALALVWWCPVLAGGDLPLGRGGRGPRPVCVSSVTSVLAVCCSRWPPSRGCSPLILSLCLSPSPCRDFPLSLPPPRHCGGGLLPG